MTDTFVGSENKDYHIKIKLAPVYPTIYLESQQTINNKFDPQTTTIKDIITNL